LFIDIHMHATRFPRTQRWGSNEFSTPEQLIERFDRTDVEKAILLPLLSPEARLGIQSTDEILDISRQWPDRFVPFCNVDPRMGTNATDSPLDEMLSLYKGCGCRGVGEVTCNLPFNDPFVENLFRHVEAAGLPLLFHISPEIGHNYGLYDEPGLPLLEGALRKFPRLSFLGHSQAFWCEMGPLENLKDRWGYPKGPVTRPGRVVDLMRKYPNLMGDLSANSGFTAISRDEKFGLEFFDEFQDRLFFGTDITNPTTPGPLRDYLLKIRAEGKMPEAIFQKVARANAVRLLKLDA
jgi:uncharacterized protein